MIHLASQTGYIPLSILPYRYDNLHALGVLFIKKEYPFTHNDLGRFCDFLYVVESSRGGKGSEGRR
jgi:hypothetical protein